MLFTRWKSAEASSGCLYLLLTRTRLLEAAHCSADIAAAGRATLGLYLLIQPLRAAMSYNEQVQHRLCHLESPCSGLTAELDDS
jgi:hypothetical protein